MGYCQRQRLRAHDKNGKTTRKANKKTNSEKEYPQTHSTNFQQKPENNNPHSTKK
jgi:hypothetical protein